MTIFTGGWSHTGNMLHQDIKRLARGIAYFQWPSGMIALLSPAAAQELSKQGLSKKNVEEQIWQNATLTMKEFRNDHYYQRFIFPILKGREMGGRKYRWPAYYLDLPDDARRCGAAAYVHKEQFGPDVLEKVWAEDDGFGL